jgi:hypothetical protein
MWRLTFGAIAYVWDPSDDKLTTQLCILGRQCTGPIAACFTRVCRWVDLSTTSQPSVQSAECRYSGWNPNWSGEQTSWDGFLESEGRKRIIANSILTLSESKASLSLRVDCECTILTWTWRQRQSCIGVVHKIGHYSIETSIQTGKRHWAFLTIGRDEAVAWDRLWRILCMLHAASTLIAPIARQNFD